MNIKSFERDSLAGLGLFSDVLVGGSKTNDTLIFVWLLSSSTIPQPLLKRGLWTTDGVWGETTVWYS